MVKPHFGKVLFSGPSRRRGLLRDEVSQGSTSPLKSTALLLRVVWWTAALGQALGQSALGQALGQSALGQALGHALGHLHWAKHWAICIGPSRVVYHAGRLGR